MKGSHLVWLSRSKGMTVDIWIRDYNPPRCFQKKISGRGKHNGTFRDGTIYTIHPTILPTSSKKNNFTELEYPIEHPETDSTVLHLYRLTIFRPLAPTPTNSILVAGKICL
jgi:hypothetical protein